MFSGLERLGVAFTWHLWPSPATRNTCADAQDLADDIMRSLTQYRPYGHRPNRLTLGCSLLGSSKAEYQVRSACSHWHAPRDVGPAAGRVEKLYSIGRFTGLVFLVYPVLWVDYFFHCLPAYPAILGPLGLNLPTSMNRLVCSSCRGGRAPPWAHAIRVCVREAFSPGREGEQRPARRGLRIWGFLVRRVALLLRFSRPVDFSLVSAVSGAFLERAGAC